MRDFTMTLLLDSPLLQSGSRSKAIDPSKMLRGPSVRGLFHTFARALVGPWLGQDNAKVARAERRLLGSAGNRDAGSPPTFRIFDVTGAAMSVNSPGNQIPILPHRPGNDRGDRDGHPADENFRNVTVACRPGGIRRDPYLPAALWATAWTAFHFGAIGNRSRRGYGSLTLTDVRGSVPSLDQLLNGRDGPAQSTLPMPPAGSLMTRNELGRHLKHGLETASQAMAGWLACSCDPALVPTAVRAAGTTAAFFQLFGPTHAFLSRSFDTPTEAMIAVMRACHTSKQSHATYAQTMGSAIPVRLASPLWVRVFQASVNQQTKTVLLATWSPTGPTRDPVNDVLAGIGADRSPLSSF